MRKQVSFALALSMVMTSGQPLPMQQLMMEKRTWYFGTAGQAAMVIHWKHL